MKKIKIQSILYLYILLCPILDCASFIFRNTIGTSISPSTFIRPIFVILACLYIFITDKKQRKLLIIAGIVYGIYSITHLYIFTLVRNSSSYSGIMHELQYLVNYTFMILNLYVYIYVFSKNKDTDKLYKCILLSISIYIISIYIAILTGTSSYTYAMDGAMDGRGYKGWFESGNSLSAILILSMFILLCIEKNKKMDKNIRIYTTIIIGLIAIFLMFLIGTKVGLFGVALVLGIYAFSHILYNIIHKIKIKQILIISGTIFALLIITFIIVFKVIGSSTLDRINDLKDMANELVDENTNEKIYITGDLYDIKNKIENGTIDENYMSKEQQKAVISLNEIATKYNLSVQKMRTLQLIYNIELCKNQANPIYLLFGNGYVAQHVEMILEMEFIAILINFGIYGFILFLVPFIAIYGYSLYKGIKKVKEINVQYMLLIAGGGLAFVLSLLSGYIFFNASTTMIIILINVLLFNKTKELK